MKAFIWRRIAKLTKNYHPEGGLLIVAESLEAARALLDAKAEKDADDEYSGVVAGAASVAPAAVYDLAADSDPAIYVFPDAGCC